MARPPHKNPTPAELEVLRVIWNHGPSTVREVMAVLNKRRARAYTSVMSLMNVMADKGLLLRRPRGRAFLYTARLTRKKNRSRMLKDLLGRAFEGSPGALVTHLLQQAEPTAAELDEIRKAILEWEKTKGDP
jgi:BlaI family penicillinase repressor